MKIYEEKSLRNFEFWGQARNNAELLTSEQLDEVEQILEDTYLDGIDATDLNDLFAYDFDTVCGWLGTSYEKLTGEDEDDDEEDDDDDE